MARGVGIAVCVLVMVVCIILVPGVRGNGAPKVPMSSILDAFRFRGYKQHEFGGSSAGAKEQEESEDMIWPMPVSVTRGKGSLILDSGVFQFAVEDGKKAPGTLFNAFLRYRAILFPPQSHSSLSTFTSSSRMLEKLLVRLDSSNEELKYGVDESYTLYIPDSADTLTATLDAKTVYGALRGLETFSQLATFDFTSKTMKITKTPYLIKDQPRFLYRGLLIDTSRHYQPVESIKSVLDSMSFSKLNVLHWHIVDEESFPLEIPSYPALWDGAYSSAERYTVDDAREIVEYARLRGIHVMPELDVPGHAASWGVGYPDLWPSPQCIEPLDVSKNYTFEVIDGIIGDFKKVFPFEFAHLGGDEVNTSCWEHTSHIQSWLSSKNISSKDAYAEFVIRTQGIAVKHGYVPVNWEETFLTFPERLSKETVVHNWLQGGTCPKAVKAGFRCILSDQGTWYLDHLDVTWDKVYNTEPLLGITDSDEKKLVIGGEVCMWGETADGSDILQTIWPRAAAAAERLWSTQDFTEQGAAPALKRFQYFRCLLNWRGIAAAPVYYGSSYAYGRSAPRDPGSCFKQ